MERRDIINVIMICISVAILPFCKSITATKGKANILLIGDSISIGYLPYVQEYMAGKAVVNRIPLKPDGKAENCQGTTYGIANLERWLGDTKWDVIHFNFGLHDIKHIDPETGKNSNDASHPNQANLFQYENNLRAIVFSLKKTGAKLIFATTTPYPKGTKPYREYSDVKKYNEVAIEIMKQNEIEVNDLYDFVLPRMADLQRPVNVHFTEMGSKKIGEQVANSLLVNMVK